MSGGAGIRAGGLVGSLEGWQALILASAGGDVTAGYDSYIGGLVGFSTATISGASASGKVGGSGLLGGLVAWNQGMSWVLRPAAGWSHKSPTRSMAD